MNIKTTFCASWGTPWIHVRTSYLNSDEILCFTTIEKFLNDFYQLQIKFLNHRQNITKRLNVQKKKKNSEIYRLQKITNAVQSIACRLAGFKLKWTFAFNRSSQTTMLLKRPSNVHNVHYNVRWTLKQRCA